MNFKTATDEQLLTIIFHDPMARLTEIFEAAEEYRRRHPGVRLKWYRYEGGRKQ